MNNEKYFSHISIERPSLPQRVFSPFTREERDFTAKGSIGGGNVVVQELTQTASQKGHQAEIITNFPYPIITREVNDQIVTFFERGDNPRTIEVPFSQEVVKGNTSLLLTDPSIGARAAVVLNDLFSQPKRRQAIPVAHHYVGGMLMSVVKKLSQRPFIYVPHALHLYSDIDGWAKLGRDRKIESAEQETRYIHIPLTRADLIAIPTQAEIDNITNELLGGSSDHSIAPSVGKMRRIPWGVNHNLFHPNLQKDENKKRARQKLHLPNNGETIIGFAGRFSPIKNIDFLVESFGNLVEESPQRPIYLALFGGEKDPNTSNNSYEKQIFEKVNSNPLLQSRVIFKGAHDSTDIMSSIDTLVLPSFYESWGLAATEAMASTIPIVVSDTPMLREVTGNNQAYINPHNIDALTAELDYLISHPEVRKDLGEIGHRQATLYQWSKTYEMLMDYSSAL